MSLQTPSSTTVNINFTDKAILTWGTTAGTVAAPNRGVTDGTTITNFIIDSADTWNFASAGAVLNKVSAGTNAAATVAAVVGNPAVGVAGNAAIINGQLLGSNARVFVLANGGIVIGGGAQVNTQSLVLSTLTEQSDGTFITIGDLTYTGASTGSITIGAAGGTAVTVGGNLSAVAGAISTPGSLSVGGDLLLKPVTAAGAISLSGTTAVGGNLTVTTNNGAIGQAVGSTVTVGAGTATVQTANLTSGTGAITLAEITNDFERVVANTSTATGTVTLVDANIVTLGAASIGGDLSVTAGGRTNTTAIATDGTVVMAGNANFVSKASNNSSVSIGNNSSIAGTATAQTSGGSVTLTTTGNLTLGAIKTDNTAAPLAGGAYTALAGTATTDSVAGTVSGITLAAPGQLAPIYTGNLTITVASPVATVAPTVKILSYTITDGGSGYTAVPAITFPTALAGTTLPTATAVLTGGVVTSITITNTGAGLTSFPTPSIAAAPANTGVSAKIAATVTLDGFTISNPGSGYGTNAAYPVSINGGAVVTPAVVTANAADNIGSLAITTAGAFNAMPGVVVTHPNANAVGAAATAVRDATTGLVTSVTITNAGVGYGTTAPSIGFAAATYVGGSITGNTTGAITNTGAQAAGSAVTLRGSTVTTGSTISTGVNSTVTLTSNAGNVTFGGTSVTTNRVTANAVGGDIVLTAGTITTGGASNNGTTASSLTATGNITIESGLSTTDSQQLNITAANASIRSGNSITLGTTNVTNNLTIRAGGTKAIALGRDTGSNATSIIVGGVLTATTDGTGAITQNDDSRFEVFGGLNLVTGYNAGGALAAGGNITLGAAAVPGALTPSVRFGVVNATTGTSAGNITLAESTSLNLGNITGGNLTATSTAGSIIDSGTIAIGTNTANLTVTGSNNVVLDNATNVMGVINVTGGVDNSFTAINSNVELRSTTNATGNTTIGTNSGFAISLGNVVTTGTVTANSGSYIDIVGNVSITGNLTLNATGNVGNASTFSTVYAGNTTRSDATGRLTGVNGVNLPLLSYATAPTVTVVGGAAPTTVTAFTPVVTNGRLTALGAAGGTGYTIAPTVTVSAPPAGGLQAVVNVTVSGGVPTFSISNAGSGYASAPTITLLGGGNPTTPATVVANLGPTGQIASFNVTNNLTNGGTVPYVTTMPVRIDVSGATTTSVLQSTGTLKVTGDTSISGPGNAILFRNNDFANVVLNNSTGGALINDVNNVTVSGSSQGNVAITAGTNGSGSSTNATTQPFTEPNTWAVTLGNLAVASLNVTATNGGAGNSGRITQNANTTVYSYGPAYFTTTNNTITIANNGNNFGRVGLTTGGGAATFVEDGTLKIGNISSGNGTVTLTSRFGGIWEDPAADVAITGSGGGTINLTSSAGSILLGNLDHAVGGGVTAVTGPFTFIASAPQGAVKLMTTTGNVTLGAIDANSLTVASGNNLTQTAASKVFGTTTLSAAANLTMTNNANNFGRLFLTTTGAASNIAVTESGTMNLGRVTQAATATGNFTATSLTGDIIDTGLGGVRPGGTNVSPGTGVTTLNAASGNILLDDPTTDFPSTGGVLFTAKDVTLSPLGGAQLYLGSAGGTSTASGNLTVTSATGSIYNAGALNITGDAFFQSGSGDILVTNASNNFGTVKFAGRIVSVTEAGNITLVTGSSATGAATFSTAGGDIDIVNRGGTISLASTAIFNASGNITLPKLIQVNDTLQVVAAGTKDLSKLSLSGDLGGKAPQNFGTGTYFGPLP